MIAFILTVGIIFAIFPTLGEDMISFVITTIIVATFFILAKRKTNTKIMTMSTNHNNRSNNMKLEISIFNSNIVNKDSSVIDITGQSHKINNSQNPYQISNYQASDSYQIPNSLKEDDDYQSYNFDEYLLGEQYKKKLNLSSQEVSWLNKLWSPNNVFILIEGCCIATIKLYLPVLKELDKELKKKGTTLTKEIKFFKGKIRKINKMRWGYDADYYSDERSETVVFLTIFKRVENCIRESFEHKRKVSGDFPYLEFSLNEEFENRIGSFVNQSIKQLKIIIDSPNKTTEIELNIKNTNRWKSKFKILCEEFKKENKDKFIRGIDTLGVYNAKNPNIKNIFFEASKFIVSYDKIASLIFYLYYLNYDLKSSKISNKQFSKTIQKTLFKTDEQLRKFEIIISDFLKNKNLKKALNNISQIYAIQRKKIILDNSAIKDVHHKHLGTVELLNEYLQDEDEIDLVQDGKVNIKEVIVESSKQETQDSNNSTFCEDIILNHTQTAALEKFVKNNFILSQSELEIFAKTKGVFKNQLIESINDTCYDNLNDILIEEDEENYTIDKNYYQQILANNDK